MMEKALEMLFDYQKFESNTELKHVIDSTRGRGRRLSLDEAELVAAAGAKYQNDKAENGEKEQK